MNQSELLFSKNVLVTTTARTIDNSIHRESRRNQLNQIYWRIKANNIINYARIEQQYWKNKSNDKNKYNLITNAWITNEKYRESIIDVIGKAIGDCVEKEGVFKGKQLGALIKFENTVPEEYEQENWNAVTLYNYVFRFLYGKKDIKAVNRQKLLDGIERDLFKEYSNILESSHQVRKENGRESVTVEEMIRKATHDISTYADAFKMEDILGEIKYESGKYKKSNKQEDMAPKLVVMPAPLDQRNPVAFNDSEHTLYSKNNRIFRPKDVLARDISHINYNPWFVYNNNQWSIVKMTISNCKLEYLDHDKYSEKDTTSFDDLTKIEDEDLLYVLDLLDGLVTN